MSCAYFHWNTSMNSLLSFIMRSPFADHRNPSLKATKAIQSQPRVVSCLRFPTFWVVFIIQPTRKEFSIAVSRLLRDPETNKVEFVNRFIITMMLWFSFIIACLLARSKSRSGDWVTKAIISSSSLLNQHYHYRSVYVVAVNVIPVVVFDRAFHGPLFIIHKKKIFEAVRFHRKRRRPFKISQLCVVNNFLTTKNL